jgi:hypothetical protein
VSPGKRRIGRVTLIAGAVIASAALVALYLALGGSSYEPHAIAEPCEEREWRSPGGVDEAAEQFTLSSLDGAACELAVSREELVLAIATEESRRRCAREHGIEDAELEEAVRAGLLRAIDDAERADALGPVPAPALREIAMRVPVDEAVALIEDASAVFETGGELLRGAESLLGIQSTRPVLNEPPLAPPSPAPSPATPTASPAAATAAAPTTSTA